MNFFQRLHIKLNLLFFGKGRVWRPMALGALAIVGFALPSVVQAAGCGLGSPEICIATIFVWIFQRLTALMGFILIMEVDALIRVAGYFNFVSPGPTAVRIGWVVTRDLANMSFIVFLMIIAFSTVIGYSKYHYEQTLKKLLVMAVIINFSKTIVGLMIDISQVVMLSFVNGFRAAAAGNFMNAFQINKLLALGDGPAEYNFGLVLAMMLAFILAAIAACVVLVMLVMLVFRIIMLWVLIILSPIAFLTAAFPLSGGYYAQWWGELKKYLIGGPVVAFFLWLALATAQQTAGNLSSPQEGWGVQSAASAQEVEGQATKSQIPSEAGRTDTILSMVIVCCIMFAGLKFAADPAITGLAAGFAGKVKGKAISALRAGTVGVAGYGLKRTAEPMLTGFGKGLARVPLIGGAGRYMALTGEKWKKDRQAGRDKLFGGPEDLARLSPGAFNRQLTGLAMKGRLDEVDKKRLDSMLGAGLKNPKIASSLGDGSGAFALSSLIRDSKGKGLQDAVGTMMTDKSASTWAKKDSSFLRSAYDKLATEAETDPNIKKTLGEFKQKFAPQLVRMTKNPNASPDDASAERILDQKALKELVPKLSTDDLKEVSGSDMGIFMEHMTGKQFRDLAVDGKDEQKLGMSSELARMPKEKALEFMRERGLNATEVPDSWYSNANVADYVLASTTGKAEVRGKIMADATRAAALRDAAKRGYQGPNAPTDDNKLAAAAVQAMSVGALKVSDLDPKILGVLSRGGDTAAIARGIDKDDPDQLAVGREVFKTILAQDPARVRNLSKNDLYNKLLPSKEEIDAAVTTQAAGVAQVKTTEREVERRGLAGDAVNVKADLSGQLKALQDAIQEDRAAGRPTATKEQQFDQVSRWMQDLTSATQQRTNAEQELSQEMQRLATATSNGGDTTAIQGAVDRLKKGIKDLDSTLAKQVATIKGIKFDEGGGGGRKNRGGGGRV